MKFKTFYFDQVLFLNNQFHFKRDIIYGISKYNINKTLIQEAARMNKLYIVYHLLTKENKISAKLFYEVKTLK